MNSISTNNLNNFRKILSVPIILNQKFQFLDKDKIKKVYLYATKRYIN